MPPSSEPRVFISYARSDGETYATWLREKLQTEHPDITLWHDIVSERSGRDWWLQITEALDHVEYVVMVATPNALKSDMVRKEWRYARQQGVCVLPVQASGVLDFDSLPRWMRTKHFAELNTPPQCDAFVAELRRECQAPRVPFMAEDLPPDFVPRPDQSEPLIAMLLDPSREREKHPVAITTALHGGGGFGKTMLARAICHDERVQEVFDDGVLWVTLGESIGEDRLKAKLTDLVRVLTGQHTDFETREAAVTRLRELLEDRDILMVIDDVWDAADLHPFLQGGPLCARLITTRNLDTLPQQCRDVKVDSMQPREAVELLGTGLRLDATAQIADLADRLGYWPLLLGIVNGTLRQRVEKMNQPVPDALTWVAKALDKRGLTAFDPANPRAREQAVESTVAVSLEPFSESERDRFRELAIFHEDVNVPLQVVATLWQASGNLDDFDSEDLCERLHRHSLLQTLDLTTREIRLHDVMRTYLQAALAKRTDPKQVHGKLIDAWDDPYTLPDRYAWQWYAYHMAEAGRSAQLRELLLSPAWLQAKLAATDATSLTADFDYLRTDEDLQLVQGAIRLSSNVIAAHPEQFVSQMVGRLLPYQDIPAIAEFTNRVAEGTQPPWLRPLQPVLHPPGTALLRTLAGHTDSVRGVALSGDGRMAVSASRDNTLKVWEVESGRELRTLAGHTNRVTAVALSGDGRMAVSASHDNTLKVWEVGSGRELRTLAGHTDSVNDVALSEDGRMAVSASWDKTLKVWEVESGRELRTLAGHTNWVSGVGLSGDGRIAVSASWDKTLKAWEVGSGRELRTLAGHTSLVNGVALSGDGRIAVSASNDNTLKVWEVGTGRELRTLAGHTNWVLGVALSGDGRIALSASYDSTLKVWEVGSGRELRTLAGHTSYVRGVALSGDGRIAVSASNDNTLKVWEVGSGRELRTLAGHTSSVGGVALSGDERIAVSASGDHTLKVWEVGSARELRTLAGHTSYVRGVALSGDGRIALSASYDSTLKVWEVESGRELRTLVGHTRAVNGVALSGDGQIAVSASSDNTLKVWDLETGTCLATFTCDGAVWCCAFSEALNLILAGDAGGHLHFLRLIEPRPKNK